MWSSKFVKCIRAILAALEANLSRSNSGRRARRRRRRRRNNNNNNNRQWSQVLAPRPTFVNSDRRGTLESCSEMGNELHALRGILFRQQGEMLQMNEAIQRLSTMPNKIDVVLDWVARGVLFVQEHLQGQHQQTIKVEPFEEF